MKSSDIQDDEIIVVDFVNDNDIDLLIRDSNLVLAIKALPMCEQTYVVISLSEADRLGYVDPDYINCEIGVSHPGGKYLRGSQRFSIVPLLLHESIDEHSIGHNQS